jgi:hypothetical protein
MIATPGISNQHASRAIHGLPSAAEKVRKAEPG